MAVVTPEIDLSLIPLYPSPDGAPSNFTDPVSLTPAILSIGIVMIIISTAFTALRVFTGIRTPRKLGPDDGLCVFSLLGGVTYWAMTYSMARDGAARHSWDVPASVITPSLMKRQVTSEIIVAPALWAGKASIMVFYIRLLGTQRWLRWTCYGLLVFSFLCYWSNGVIGLVYCIPHGNGQGWDAALLRRCAEPVVSTMIIGVGSVVIDMVLFALPFPIIAGLNLKSSTKRGLLILFLFAFLINVTSIAGLAYRVIVYQGSDGPIWEGMNVAITSFDEIFGTIAVGCGPALASFWFNIFVKTRFYESIMSLSRMRSSRARAAASSSAVNQSGPYHRQATGRHSSKSLVAGDIEAVVPLDSIHKKTTIAQESFAMAERDYYWQCPPDLHTYNRFPGE